MRTFIIHYWLPASIIGTIVLCFFAKIARPKTFDQMPESTSAEAKDWDEMKIVPMGKKPEDREPAIRKTISL